MGPRLAGLAAAASAVALLVATPAGVAIGLALASGESAAGAVSLSALRLDVLTACGWAILFLAIQRLSTSYRARWSVPVSTIVFGVALALGILGFYRTEPGPARALLSFQYAVLVVLALWLFGVVASWSEEDPHTSSATATTRHPSVL